jgi:general secretion pathway protein C
VTVTVLSFNSALYNQPEVIPPRFSRASTNQESVLAADRLSYRNVANRASEWLQHAGAGSLGDPANSRRLRQVLLTLAVVWSLFALTQLLWALFPQEDSMPAQGSIINSPTLSVGVAGASAIQVDIDALRSWPLFGEPGAALAVEPETPLATEASAEREGIEKGARETRLDLVLRGVIAFTADGAGSAIVEHRGQQAIYSVDDVLPVPGRVTLAKVMPLQVVLDNGGTYELLLLYQPSDLDSQLGAVRAAVPSAASAAQPAGTARVIDKRADQDATALASGYRDQLYQDPQSLAELVRIAAVREGGELQGYRLSPGRDQAQFEQLGFRSGDLVVAVNGMPLSDPANTMRLYQAMRGASEASFDLLRSGEAIAVSVSLGAAAGEQ